MGCAAALLLALLWSPAAADDGEGPPDGTVVAMAQHMVQEHFMRRLSPYYHIDFDVAYLHPQPEPGFWAVVGGFVSEQSQRNIYVAAVRQVCPDFSDVACWVLEQLAINETIVIDRGQPL